MTPRVSKITCSVVIGSLSYAVWHGHDEPHQPGGSLAPSLPLVFATATSNIAVVTSNIATVTYQEAAFIVEPSIITERPVEYGWPTHHGFDDSI